ncbi:MAG: HEAT repeat domain-containing protein [Bythopirellula sp.]|nr:HEAT repeat domain-containing protein [Bythopirellula sp.]
MRLVRYHIVLSVILITYVPARADIFHLTEGGQLVGQLAERGPNDEYIIHTQLGGTVTLAKDQVQEIVRQSEHQQDYESRSRSLPDTVAAHRSLATWCKEQQLAEHAEHHLRRIIELDPDDEQARTSLGYQQHQGQWLTRDDVMAQRGMRFYDGTYRTEQDVALRERTKAFQNAEVEWLRQLKLWRNWLDSRRPDRAEEAELQIQAITDPRAATSLVKMLDGERDDSLRPMWMEILSQVRHPVAMRKLIDLSIDEPDRDTRLQCLEYLLRMNDEIDIQPYVKALRSKDNEIVNIAAEALGQIGNPEAIRALIDALVTRHKFELVSQGEMSASFSPDGSGGAGLSAGNKPKFVDEDVENIEVRRALIALSGDQDFGFDETAWSRWYENQRSQQVYVDPRRDE